MYYVLSKFDCHFWNYDDLTCYDKDYIVHLKILPSCVDYIVTGIFEVIGFSFSLSPSLVLYSFLCVYYVFIFVFVCVFG